MEDLFIKDSHKSPKTLKIDPTIATIIYYLAVRLGNSINIFNCFLNRNIIILLNIGNNIAPYTPSHVLVGEIFFENFVLPNNFPKNKAPLSD